jgi:hypothetical protein
MMRVALALTCLVACRSNEPAKTNEGGSAGPATPSAANDIAAKCIAAVDALATDLGPTEKRLRETLARDRVEASQLLRDSVELVLVTRELLCSQADRAAVASSVARLEATRKAFDALLAATLSPNRPVDEAALVDRFSRALLGQ